MNNKLVSIVAGILSISALLFLQLLAAPKAHATTYNVDSVAVPGGCGLVDAIAEVATPGSTACDPSTGTDIINIAAGIYDLSSLPAVAIEIPGSSLTINGAAAKTTIFDGKDTAGGLTVNSAGTNNGNLFVNNLTLKKFNVANPFASVISMIAGVGVFNNLIVTENYCPESGGGTCSIFVGPQATLSNSVIYNNASGILITSGTAGTGVDVQLNVFNNTFYDNTGSILQVINFEAGKSSTVNFVNNTVVKNIAQLGAALAVDVSPGSGEGPSILNLKNNIFLNNTLDSGSGAVTTCAIGSETGVINSLGGNIADDATCTSFGANDSNNTVTEIASSLESVGDTFVLPISYTSKAYNYAQAGGSGGLTTPDVDQRGVSRPQYSAYDSGAYEFNGTIPGPTPSPSGNSTLASTGLDTKLPTIVASLLVFLGLATLTYSLKRK